MTFDSEAYSQKLQHMDLSELHWEGVLTGMQAGIHAVIADQKHSQGIWTQSYGQDDYEKKLLQRVLQEHEAYKRNAGGEVKGFKLKDFQYPAPVHRHRIRKSTMSRTKKSRKR